MKKIILLFVLFLVPSFVCGANNFSSLGSPMNPINIQLQLSPDARNEQKIRDLKEEYGSDKYYKARSDSKVCRDLLNSSSFSDPISINRCIASVEAALLFQKTSDDTYSCYNSGKTNCPPTKAIPPNVLRDALKIVNNGGSNSPDSLPLVPPGGEQRKELIRSCKNTYGQFSTIMWDGKGSFCGCESGFLFNKEKTQCILGSTTSSTESRLEEMIRKNKELTSFCIKTYGQFSINVGDKKHQGCGCTTGYEFNADDTQCIQKVVTPTTIEKSNDINKLEKKNFIVSESKNNTLDQFLVQTPIVDKKPNIFKRFFNWFGL